MARSKAHEADSDTTVVNIADFQRTRDSPTLQLHQTLPYLRTPSTLPTSRSITAAVTGVPMQKSGHVILTHDQLAMVVGNEQRTVEMIHALTDQLANLPSIVVSSSADRATLAKTYQKVIVALATLQNSVQDLSKAYINHANTVLNPGRAGVLDLNLTTTLLDSGLLHRAPSPGMKQEAQTEVKKKRKRAAHDPNAPKRALTPYFLYMRSARPEIAQELGPNAKPKEVADEGTRRWGVMADADKNVWNAAYQKNLAIYRVKTAAYKAGKPVPSDEEAEKIAQTDEALASVPVEEEEVEEEPEVIEEEETESESSPEPVRAPSPPKTAKRRKTGEKPAPTPVKENPKPAAAKSSPEKEKRSKKSKKEPTPPPAPKPADKKKKSKKAT